MERFIGLLRDQTDQFEITKVEQRLLPMTFADLTLLEIRAQDVCEYALRVVRDGKLGFVCGTGRDPEKLVADALRAAELGQKITFDFPSAASEPVDVYDPVLDQMEAAELVAEGEAIIEPLRAHADIPVTVTIERAMKHVTVANSTGKIESYDKTLLRYFLESKFKGSKLGITKEINTGKWLPFPREWVADLIREYRHCETKVHVPSGQMPVLFLADCTWELFFRFNSGLNGDAVARGISPLKDRLGERVLGCNVTIIDDPREPYAQGSAPFDDEGVPTGTQIMFEQGVLRGFLYDLESQAKAKASRAGNAWKMGLWGRDLTLYPGPHFTNLVMQPGEADLHEMIASMDRGLVVQDALGFHSGNFLTGEFSMTVGSGFYVENGKIQGRPMDTMIAGNVYDAFTNICALSNRRVGNYLGSSPDILFAQLNVAGKG